VEDVVPSVPLDLDLDEQFLNDPWGAWDRIREDHPIFRAEPGTAAGESIWVCTQDRVIRDGYQLGHEYFSNALLFPYHAVMERRLGLVEMDPPIHTGLRKAMAPYFAPRVVEARRARMHEIAREVIAEFIDRGECEYVSDFAKRYVAAIFLEYLGVPMSELDNMLQWAYDAVHLTTEVDPDGVRRAEAMGRIRTMMLGIASDRMTEPQADLTTYMLKVAEDTEISDADFAGTLILLFLGGLDTTAGSLSFAARHFAENPADRAAATANPAAVQNAAEEVLRAFGILNAAKLVVKDVDFHGCPIKKGDRIVFATSSAGRDPQVFEDADKFRVDRESYRHIAFGLGPHRCIGSHFARAELQVYIEEWHKHIPDYSLSNPQDIRNHGGTVMGVDKLRLTWK
jgi:cytochrome P450